jgi:UDP-galactopyranose mutase
MPDRFDILVVGAGLFGATTAHELTRRGFRCLVLEQRSHVGGNCYTEQRDGIHLHLYGPHIFHTSDARIWHWIKQFSDFNGYRHRVKVDYRGKRYSFPLNLFTFRELWGVESEQQARGELERRRIAGADPRSLEGWALSRYGREIYETFIRGYSQKQWGKHPRELPAAILKRLPIRFGWNEEYFDDRYQGVPIAGYTAIFDKLLAGSSVRPRTDYFSARRHFDSLARATVYTGPLDRFFDYRFGRLEYRGLELDHSRLDVADFQGFAQVNYSDERVPYTRIVEHKHFHFGEQPCTWITREYPAAAGSDVEPMYPLRDEANLRTLERYHALARQPDYRRCYFGGRLAEYRYYDMHQVIASALKTADRVAADLGELSCAAT